MSQSGYPNLEAACGGVINPDTLLTFQKAMREYEVLMSGMRQLLAPATPEQIEERRRADVRADVFGVLKPFAKTPLDLGVARFAADVAELVDDYAAEEQSESEFFASHP